MPHADVLARIADPVSAHFPTDPAVTTDTNHASMTPAAILPVHGPGTLPRGQLFMATMLEMIELSVPYSSRNCGAAREGTTNAVFNEMPGGSGISEVAGGGSPRT
jgi:hypothetical protein